MDDDKYFLADEITCSTPFSTFSFKSYFPKKKMSKEEMRELLRMLLYEGCFDGNHDFQQYIMKILKEGELDRGIIDPRDEL